MTYKKVDIGHDTGFSQKCISYFLSATHIT